MKYIAILVAALTGGIAEAASQGVINADIAAALVALIAAAATEYARRQPAPEKSGSGTLVSLVLLVSALGCTPAQRAGVPVLSAIDAVGRGVSQVMGWCEDAGADRSTLARAQTAIEERDYAEALALSSEMVTRLREAGASVPEEVEVTLRLAEGALAAGAIQDGMRALSQ